MLVSWWGLQPRDLPLTLVTSTDHPQEGLGPQRVSLRAGGRGPVHNSAQRASGASLKPPGPGRQVGAVDQGPCDCTGGGDPLSSLESRADEPHLGVCARCPRPVRLCDGPVGQVMTPQGPLQFLPRVRVCSGYTGPSVGPRPGAASESDPPLRPGATAPPPADS